MNNQQQAALKALKELELFFNNSTRNLAEADANFAPKPGMYTVAQQIAHAALVMEWFLEGAFNPNGMSMDFAAHETAIAKITSLADARAWFHKACREAEQALSTRSEKEWAQPIAGEIMKGELRIEIFQGLVDHTAHHRGALTVYARLLGKTAPIPYF